MKATDLDHLKRGSAILVACLIQALREGDPALQDRFLNRMVEAYGDLRGKSHGNVQHELELLDWTHELLTGSSIAKAGGKSVLDS